MVQVPCEEVPCEEAPGKVPGGACPFTVAIKVKLHARPASSTVPTARTRCDAVEILSATTVSPLSSRLLVAQPPRLVLCHQHRSAAAEILRFGGRNFVDSRYAPSA
jgi:hypothetical protein